MQIKYLQLRVRTRTSFFLWLLKLLEIISRNLFIKRRFPFQDRHLSLFTMILPFLKNEFLLKGHFDKKIHLVIPFFHF